MKVGILFKESDAFTYAGQIKVFDSVNKIIQTEDLLYLLREKQGIIAVLKIDRIEITSIKL